ncbi:MAG TPA: translation initiation factor IF-2 [Ignavibacteria bacterium]|nr:translation initiation factor IF-2 [Ignavibacteria bacterium]
MQGTGINARKQKVIGIVKDINISKDDLFNFLKSIGVEATINTTLEMDIVDKVYGHFKKDLEKEDKRLKKSVEFAKTYHVEFSDAQEQMRMEEEKKQKIEDEIRLKKFIEEENKRKEEEKKLQEEKAYKEREKNLKDEKNKEKEKKAALKSADEKLKTKSRKEDEVNNTKKKEATLGSKRTVKKEDQAGVKAEFVKKEPGAENKPSVSGAQREVRKPYEGSKPRPAHDSSKPRPPYDPSKSRTPYDSSKPRPPYDPSKPRPPYDPSKPRFDKGKGKGTYEKISITDIKGDKRKPKPPADGVKPAGDADKTFTRAKLPVRPTDDRRFKDKKDKEKKRPETEQERRRRVKLEKGHRAKDATQKEIDEAIRDTFAKIDDDSGSSARSLARKRKKKERIEEEKKIQELKEANKHILKVNEFLSTSELANIMGVDANEIIKTCFKLGIMISINQRLEKDIIELICGDFGYQVEFQKEYEEDILEEKPDNAEDLKERAPVVTVMGHVDHGKTSLLDYLRKANVVAGEAGGITQHIGAYKVKLDSGKQITFLDTPGHEAFTAMRARGGQAADIVVLVVAADDSVMPQTVEAINHARAANVPIVIAINKVDKPESNPERIKQQLSEKDILVEEWGGKYQSVEISAKQGKNIEQLLEKILVEAELLDLKADPHKEARGVVLEAKLDKGKGPIATVLVQKGTLKVGDSFVSGIYSGKVKAMFDERERKIEEALPSTPVVVLGFDGVPQAGDTFVVLESEKDTKAISLKRQQLKREQDFRQVKFVTLDDISKQIQEGKQVELKIILKADTDGSAEALADSLHKLTTGETKVLVIHKAVGSISESDILLAEASGAIVIGFNVRPNLNARKLAEKNNIDVRLYNIIYNLIDEVKHALEGMLAPDISEEVTATIEVRQTFKVPKIGLIAGCYVLDGKITRNNKVRLLRDGFVIFDGGISSLKRIKDDVREVESGYECGIGLENFNDVKVGDIIEGYKIVETKRKLQTQ